MVTVVSGQTDAEQLFPADYSLQKQNCGSFHSSRLC